MLDMKITSTFFICSIALTLMSCESGTSHMASTAVNVGGSVTGQNVVKESFEYDAANLEIMEPTGMRTISEENVLTNIHRNLMAAENEAELLDIKFSMSDEPVENGVFIFGIESADNKILTIEMYDEEGFHLTANNKFHIQEGNNYKALNVSGMENGTYVFRLRDDKGREINRKVDIAHEQK